MADLRNKKHVFFDLDDTLWDFQRNSAIVLRQLFTEHGLAGRLNTGADNFLAVYTEINLALWTKYYKREIDKDYLRNHRFNIVFNRFGFNDYELGLRITSEYLLRAPKGTLLVEGCVDLLNYLKDRYTLHIITNGFSEVQATKIDGSSLRPYFKNILISEDHGLVKPDVRIFRLGEQLAGALPHECVMIGDNFEADIEGARNAGWDCAYLCSSERAGYDGIRISRLSELRAFL